MSKTIKTNDESAFVLDGVRFEWIDNMPVPINTRNAKRPTWLDR